MATHDEESLGHGVPGSLGKGAGNRIARKTGRGIGCAIADADAPSRGELAKLVRPVLRAPDGVRIETERLERKVGDGKAKANNENHGTDGKTGDAVRLTREVEDDEEGPDDDLGQLAPDPDRAENYQSEADNVEDAVALAPQEQENSQAECNGNLKGGTPTNNKVSEIDREEEDFRVTANPADDASGTLASPRQYDERNEEEIVGLSWDVAIVPLDIQIPECIVETGIREKSDCASKRKEGPECAVAPNVRMIVSLPPPGKHEGGGVVNNRNGNHGV